MFKKELKNKLSQIFGLKKTTFDAPGESFEQDTLFIEISSAQSKVTQSRETAKVEGQIVVYSQGDKLPYGFFNKRIEQADPSLTRDFMFFNMDQNVANSPARIQNIYERRCSFVYLYSAQYDPSQGSLTSIELEVSED